MNFNSRNELLDFLLDVDSGPFNFDSACFVQLLAYLLSGAKGSFSNTDRTGKTVGGVASDSEGMPQFQVKCIAPYDLCFCILRLFGTRCLFAISASLI